jgi:hypothetical protein
LNIRTLKFAFQPLVTCRPLACTESNSRRLARNHDLHESSGDSGLPSQFSYLATVLPLELKRGIRQYSRGLRVMRESKSSVRVGNMFFDRRKLLASRFSNSLAGTNARLGDSHERVGANAPLLLNVERTIWRIVQENRVAEVSQVGIGGRVQPRLVKSLVVV